MRPVHLLLTMSTVPLFSGICAGQGSVDTARFSAASAPVYTSQLELPDAPGALLSLEGSEDSAGKPENLAMGEGQIAAGTAPLEVKKYAITIKPGQTASTLSAGDKFAMGIRKQVALGALASWTVSAGYSHLLDNRPHYGTDSAGFGERLGAAALRDTTQSIFFYGVYSNLFRTDPRYYVLGPTHPFKQRAIYAASRVVITRKDSGGNTGNWALVSGIASSASLANAYYPGRDQSVTRTVTGVLTSLAIRAGTQELREFGGDIRKVLHLKQK